VAPDASARVRVVVELSGEHPTLPRAEVLAAFEAEGVIVRELAVGSSVLRADASGPVPRSLARLGLAHVVCEELVRGSFEDVRAWARDQDLAGRRFRVRARGIGIDLDIRGVEGALGSDLGRTGTVDLAHPQVDLRLLAADEFVLGRVFHRVERSALEKRKVARRPFSRPISLHPKLARALVNLSRVPTAGVLLDPFCGTGGILLEASRIGLRSVGADAAASMVRGARASLRSLDEQADLVLADAGRGPWRPGRVVGIATDPPYGRAATTRREPREDLYDRAFGALAEVLPRGGHLAVGLPSEDAVEIVGRHLELLERHALRVHKSLTRIFCAFRRG